MTAHAEHPDTANSSSWMSDWSRRRSVGRSSYKKFVITAISIYLMVFNRFIKQKNRYAFYSVGTFAFIRTYDDCRPFWSAHDRSHAHECRGSFNSNRLSLSCCLERKKKPAPPSNSISTRFHIARSSMPGVDLDSL